jgi:hypothetical protein
MTSADQTGAAENPAGADTSTVRSGTSTAVFRAALRGMLWLLAVLVVVGPGVGWAVVGSAGAWAALIGVAITLVFSGTTVVAMLATAESDATTTLAVVMGSWLAKMLVVIVVLGVLRGHDFYDRTTLAVVLLIGVIGSAVLDYRAVRQGRVPYVQALAPTGDHRPDETGS